MVELDQTSLLKFHRQLFNLHTDGRRILSEQALICAVPLIYCIGFSSILNASYEIAVFSLIQT